MYEARVIFKRSKEAKFYCTQTQFVSLKSILKGCRLKIKHCNPYIWAKQLSSSHILVRAHVLLQEKMCNVNVVGAKSSYLGADHKLYKCKNSAPL